MKTPFENSLIVSSRSIDFISIVKSSISLNHFKNTSNHLYRIRVPERDKTIKELKKNGIQTGIHYASLHNHQTYKINNLNCPKSEAESSVTLSIPFHEKLKMKDLNCIINA